MAVPLKEMLEQERHEAKVALYHLAGDSIDSEPLYFQGVNGKSILTYAGALNVAKLLGIERINETIRQSSRNGRPATFATVTVKLNRSKRIGAAVSRHSQVACELAFRNAVKQIIPGLLASQPHDGVYGDIRIRRIDRSPRGEQRFKEAIKASNLIASLVPDGEDVDWDVQQEDFGWAEELAFETLREGF